MTTKVKSSNLFQPIDIPTLSANTISVAEKITHTDNANTAIKFPAADTVTVETAGSERMRITSTGNVGIATTSPIGLLDASSGGYAIVMGADSGTTTRTDATSKLGRFGGYHYTNAEEPVCLILSSAEATNNVVSVGGGTGIMNAATQLRFFTAANSTTVTGTERMRIDSSGNVGIGTTSPSVFSSTGQILAVVSTAPSFSSGGIVNYDAQAAGADVGGVITLGGQDGNVANRAFAAFKGGKENATSGDYASYAAFATRSNGGSLTERMRVTSTGNVGIATTSPSARLDVAGDIEVNSNVNLNSEATTLATTTKTQVASFATVSFRSGKLIVQAYDTFTNEVQVSELLVAHNGTTASATEYGVVFTGANPLVVYDVDISAGNVRLLAQRTTPNPTQYTVSETLLSAFDPAVGSFSWDSNTASPGPA